MRIIENGIAKKRVQLVNLMVCLFQFNDSNIVSILNTLKLRSAFNLSAA